MPSAAAAPSRRTPSSNGDRGALYYSRRVEDEEVKPYVIVSDLGKGSFATVYRGYHAASYPISIAVSNLVLQFFQETRQAVAIKTVNRNGLSQKLFENLRGEIDILKALSHRHITRLLDLVVRISCSYHLKKYPHICFEVWRTQHISHH